MPTQPMTKFVALNVATAQPCLYLKNPNDEQLDAVLAWMHTKQLDMVTCLEGHAIFTKTGKGKPSPAIAIEFTSTDPSAAKTMAELYPAPKSLDGTKLTNHEVTDQVTDIPIAPIQSNELADHMATVFADATAHAMAAIALTKADAAQSAEPTPLGSGTTYPLGIPSGDDVLF